MYSHFTGLVWGECEVGIICDQEQCFPIVGPWTMIHLGKLVKNRDSLNFTTVRMTENYGSGSSAIYRWYQPRAHTLIKEPS